MDRAAGLFHVEPPFTIGMYNPAAFRVEDPAALEAFMAANGFAVVVTHDGGETHASHLPVLYHRDADGAGVLRLHLARANPQVAHFSSGRGALVIFTGPHAYVSPSWYATTPAVPTWNYTAVHAHGIPSVVTDPARVVGLLDELVEAYEAGREGRWDGVMPEEYRDRMLQGLVAVEIRITRLEGKFKLSQNRPGEDRAGVYRALAASEDPGDRACAAAMQAAGVVPGRAGETGVREG